MNPYINLFAGGADAVVGVSLFGNVAPEQFEVWRPPEGAECRMSSHVPHAALCRMSQAVLLFSSPTLLPLTLGRHQGGPSSPTQPPLSPGD